MAQVPALKFLVWAFEHLVGGERLQLRFQLRDALGAGLQSDLHLLAIFTLCLTTGPCPAAVKGISVRSQVWVPIDNEGSSFSKACGGALLRLLGRWELARTD